MSKGQTVIYKTLHRKLIIEQHGRVFQFLFAFSIVNLGIYQRSNQNSYFEEEQTKQWPKENVQKDKQRFTKHTQLLEIKSPIQANIYRLAAIVSSLYVCFEFDNTAKILFCFFFFLLHSSIAENCDFLAVYSSNTREKLESRAKEKERAKDKSPRQQLQICFYILYFI